MHPLNQTACTACSADSKALSPERCKTLLAHLDGWQMLAVAGVAQLSKTYRFGDFSQALDFTNQIGRLSEEQNHHPALLTEWGKVTVNWWSHSVSGLHQNDFIMAARADATAAQATGLKPD